MSDMKERIQEAKTDAEHEIWTSVMDHFPECEGGELSIGATCSLSVALEEAITEWVSNNSPKETSCLSQFLVKLPSSQSKPIQFARILLSFVIGHVYHQYIQKVNIRKDFFVQNAELT